MKRRREHYGPALREEMLIFWREHVAHNDVPPTVRDAVREFGLSSTAVAFYHLQKLVAEGKLRHVPRSQHAYRLPFNGRA